MKLWTARADITPSSPLPLAGYSHRTASFSRAASLLEANIVAFDTDRAAGPVVLVSLDTLFASDALRAKVLTHLNTAGPATAELVLVASHTHFAPSLDPEKPQLGLVDPAYLNWVAKQIASAISGALAAKPTTAILAYGTSRCDGSVYRRRRALSTSKQPPFLRLTTALLPNTRVEHPRTLQLLLGRSTAGAPLVALASWPCHPVATPDQTTLSADYPGAIRSHLRQVLDVPDLPVLFLPGFCGDIRPHFTRSRFSLRSFLLHPFMFAPLFAVATRAGYDRFCGKVGAALDAALGTMEPLEANSAMRARRVEVPLDELFEGGTGTMPVIHLSSGPLSFTLIGAEVCSPYYALLDDDEQTPAFLSGYADRCFGYMPSDQQIAEGGYEAERFFGGFSWTGPFRHTIQSVVQRAVTDARQ